MKNPFIYLGLGTAAMIAAMFAPMTVDNSNRLRGAGVALWCVGGLMMSKSM